MTPAFEGQPEQIVVVPKDKWRAAPAPAEDDELIARPQAPPDSLPELPDAPGA